MTEVHWSQQNERGSAFATRLMVKLSLLIGRRLSRPILYSIALYFFLSSADTRRYSRHYLQRVLPKVGHRHVFQHFLRFATTVHDRVFLLQERRRDFHIESYGLEDLHHANDEHGGLLLFGAHIGSFDVIRSVARQEIRPVSMAMYADNARQIMTSLNAINPNASADILPLGQLNSMLAIQERIAARHIVGVLADRNFGQDTLTPTTVLDSSAGLPDGPFRLAAALRVPVFFMVGLYLGGNRYAVHFHPVFDFRDCQRKTRDGMVNAARQRYAELITQYCRQAPYNWFNFFDFWSDDKNA